MEIVRTGKIRLTKAGETAASAGRAFGRILSPVWSALCYNPMETLFPLSVVCIYISRGGVNVAHARRSMAQYRIILSKSYLHEGDSVPSPEDVAADVALFMKDAGLGKTDAVLVVPRSWLILKTAELPSAVQENLGEVVAFEFDRFTPFSAQDALYDYYSEKASDDKTGLFIVAANASVVNGYIERLAAGEVAVRRVEFDISALADLCRFVSGLDTFIFAGVSGRGCDCGFMRKGLLRSAVSHEFTAADDNKKAEEAEGFIGKLKKDAAAKEASVPVLLAFGDDAAVIKSSMSHRANLAFRTLAEFGDKIKGLVSFSAATGVAIEYLCPKAGGFNLLSRGSREGSDRSFVLTYILACAVMASLALCLFVPMQTERDHLDNIDREIARRKSEVVAIEKVRGEIEAINRKVALMDSFKSERPPYIDLVKELTERIPQNAWLTRVRITGPKVNIEGYAQSATSLVQLLEASKYYGNVEFSAPTFRDSNMGMDRFQIKLELREQKKEPSNEKQ
jgi:Tfp pilus assembly protein PilN